MVIGIRLNFKEKTGYVFAEYVNIDESKLEQTTTTEKEETIKKEEITINTEKDNTKEQTTENEEQSNNENTNLIIKKNTKIKIVPNISSNVIYTAKKDININIIEQLKGWSYINVNGINGWVRTDKIVEKNEVLPDKEETLNTKKEVSKKEETTTTNKTETKIAYIKYDTVNLRKKASTSAAVLAKLKLNDEVTVLENVNSTWAKIEIDGMTGYVSTELLANEKQEEVKKEEAQNDTTSRDGQTASREEEKETNKKEEVPKKEEITTTTAANKTEIPKKEENDKVVSTKVTGEQVVEYAKKYLGCNYVYGGKTPKGFDCSGFTYYVYKNFGYNLSTSSKGQATNGKEVAKNDLRPGDIIIFKNQSLTAIGHVGIYIGNNKIIHASEPGVGVIITDLDAKGYNYNKRYVTARRII